MELYTVRLDSIKPFHDRNFIKLLYYDQKFIILIVKATPQQFRKTTVQHGSKSLRAILHYNSLVKRL